VDGDLAVLYDAYRAELDRLGRWDRDLERRHAAERVQSDLDAWHGEPVFAYGFEDLTAAEWALLEALSGRAEVQVSLPYEPGRVAFASLRRTADGLAALADGRTQELAPRFADYAAPALAHLERALFEERPPAPVPALRDLRASASPLEGVRTLVRTMLRNAYGLDAPPAGETSRVDLRCYDAALRLLDELDGWQRLGEDVATDDVVAALDRAEVRGSYSEPGRVAVMDLLWARTRRSEVVFLVGLEEGSLPRR